MGNVNSQSVCLFVFVVMFSQLLVSSKYVWDYLVGAEAEPAGALVATKAAAEPPEPAAPPP